MITNVWWGNCRVPNPCGTGFSNPARNGECLTGAAAQMACTVAAAAIIAGTPFNNPARAECFCTRCMDLFAACIADATCRDLAACATRNNCHLETCAQPCAAEIARLASPYLTTITALGDCRIAADEACGFASP